MPFLIGTLAVVLMFQANLLIYLFKTFSMAAMPTPAILKFLLYKTPYFLNMTLPVGIALATSLAMSSLARESELTAMRAAGASILRVMVPISIFGLLVGVGNFYLEEKVMPPAEKAAARLSAQMMVLGMSPEFRSDVSLHIGTYWVNIKTVSRGENGALQLNNVFLFERPQDYTVGFYMAEQGSYKNGVWRFPNAQGWHFVGKAAAPPGSTDYQLDQFKAGEMNIYQPTNIEDIFAQPQATEKTLSELRQAISEQRAMHSDTRSLEISYYNRFSVPAACYVFAIVAPVFAIWFGRSGGFVGILLSILMVMLYYNVYVISSDVFGEKGWFSPIVAAWLPDVLFVALGIIGLRRLE